MAPRIDKARLDQRVDDLVFATIAEAPERTAASCRGETLTYAALGARIDAIAAALAARGIGRGDLVGVFMPRSVDMLATLLAILRAGAAYVPLDPGFPPDRLAFMAADAGLKLIVTAREGEADLLPREIGRLALAGVGAARAPFAPPAGKGDDLAYVLYTSGSTGKPKGVAVTHGNVVNFLLSMAAEPGLGADDVFLAVTTISFDISGLELFLPLTVGASVVIAAEDDALDGARLKSLIAEHGVTAMQATPTGWRVLLEAGFGATGRFKALVGGEALPPDVARALARAAGEVWNMYGPTETTIWSACYRLPASGEPVLIGAPIANTAIYVLDRNGNPQPQGVVGEIFIGGAGVARGYWRRDELTAERFPPDPYAPEAGARMYRTGDLGRYLRDGQLEFRGRIDAQVKVRGHRVELGEIEAALGADPGVRAAAVRLFDAGGGDARLVAYVEPEPGAAPDPTRLRETLRETLPHYMIPSQVVALDRLPLTPNGKIDRNRLLEPPRESGAAARAHVEPASATERAVARVFCEVLAVPAVSADANFFDLGGHSILAIRALALLRREIAPALDIRALFDAADLRDLARRIDALAAKTPALEVFEF